MRKLFWGASLATLVLAGQSHAQDAAQADASAPAQTAANDFDGIVPIVVTANRRAESVQDSSLSIAVIGGDDLAQAGVSEATDLGATVKFSF